MSTTSLDVVCEMIRSLKEEQLPDMQAETLEHVGAINDRLDRLNGSVARVTDRVNALESKREVDEKVTEALAKSRRGIMKIAITVAGSVITVVVLAILSYLFPFLGVK